MTRHTSTLRRAAGNKRPPAPFVSTRTCRPCQGTGVGECFGEACDVCGGTGDAPSSAPPRLRRRAQEVEPAAPTNAQLDQLGRLIDVVDYHHPEHEYASDLIGRTDATEVQVLAAIAALEPLVPQRADFVPRYEPRYVPMRRGHLRPLARPRPWAGATPYRRRP